MFMFSRIIHIILAISVLITSSGVSIPKGFCMGKFLQSVAHRVKGECGSEKYRINFHENKTEPTEQSRCGQNDLTDFRCFNKTKNCPIKALNIAKSDQDLDTVSVGFTLKKVDNQYFTLKYFAHFSNIDYSHNPKLLNFLNYHPPPLERDIIILFLNFRC